MEPTRELVLQVTPEPSPSERQALVEALAGTPGGEGAGVRPWAAAGLEDATAPFREQPERA